MTPRKLGPGLSLAFVVVLLTVPIAASASNWGLTLTGGAGIPTGDFADIDAQTGSILGLDICMDVNQAFAVGVDGSLNKFKHQGEGGVEDLGGGATLTANKDKYKVVQFGIHGKYKIKTSGKIEPYVMLGLGIYNLTEDYEYTYEDAVLTQVFTDESDSLNQPGSRFGGKLGVGANYMVSPTLGLGMSADFNHASMDKDKYEISSAQYWAIRGRVTYHIMKK